MSHNLYLPGLREKVHAQSNNSDKARVQLDCLPSFLWHVKYSWIKFMDDMTSSVLKHLLEMCSLGLSLEDDIRSMPG